LEIATDRVFRAIDTFDDGIVPEASLSVVGSAEEGEMQIRHGSETVQAPFVVGNATTNGTAGALSGAATNTVLPLRSFPFSFTQGNISLLSAAIRPVEPVPDPQPFPTPQESLPEISDDFVNNQLRKPPEIQPIVELEKRQNILGVLPSDRILRERLDLEQNLRLARVRNLPTAIEGIENLRQQEFQNYFQEEFTFQFVSFTDIVEQLQAIATATNTTPAVLYVLSNSNAVDLLLVTPDGEPIHQVVRNANRVQLLAKVQEFSSEIILSARYQNQDYLPLAQQLYQWLIAPIAPTLEARGIDTIAFSMDEGLRLLPVAALHDGEQFLVENYSVGLIPSLNLTDTTYKPLGNLPILAMGASEFTRLAPLPAVSVEIDIIANQLWSGEAFLNEAFTLENLQRQRASEPYKIVHLATHANFQAGNPRNSYIQLWDTQLNLAQLRELGWNDPPLSLLVLSACRTALGSPEAELGFAGLAVQSGAQTAIASLISVSDEGTLALMSQFYQALKTAPIKAEALRQAQLALLNKQVWIEGDRLSGTRGTFPLPSELIQGTQRNYFDHPYYWSAFTLIGSPW
jgi:CHAT domain-containing protein